MCTSFLSSITPELLEVTFENHISHGNATGVDGITTKMLAQDLTEQIEVISRKVSNGTYEFSVYKEKLVLKGRSSLPRSISIPTNRDKLLIKVLQKHLSTLYHELLNENVVKKEIGNIKSYLALNKADSFIKVDITNFFPSINHEKLMAILSKKIKEPIVLDLIEKIIKQSTYSLDDTHRDKYQNTRGIPQGLSISGILADIYLNDIDTKFAKKMSGIHYSRFVDDILILTPKTKVNSLIEHVQADMAALSLNLHPFKPGSDKSSWGSLSDSFQFLGYQFLAPKISVRPSSVKKIFDGVNKVFLKHYKYKVDKDINELYRRLNLKITGCFNNDKQYGWVYFFSHINDEKLLYKLDSHVKKACKRFGVPYDASVIKKFSRTFFEIKKGMKSNYIPNFNKNEPDLKNPFIYLNAERESLISEIQEDIVFY